MRGEISGRPYAGCFTARWTRTATKSEYRSNRARSDAIRESGAIEKHYAKSAEWLKKNTDGMEGLRRIVRDTMRRSRSLPEFAAALSAEGVQLIVRQNTQGRIYGITFIDHDGGLIVNGSKLGRNKEFAANRFHELFGAHTADELEREVSGQNDERPLQTANLRSPLQPIRRRKYRNRIRWIRRPNPG